MSKLFYFITFLFTIILSGQTSKLKSYSKQYVYSLNPKDTTQKILTHIYTKDICGNETSHCDFDYIDYLSFESQKSKSLSIKDRGYREYNYGNNCNPINVIIYDENKKILEKYFYNYNENNYLDELLIIDSNNKQLSKYKYNYDKKGNLIKETRYDNKNKADHIIKYKYLNNKVCKEIRKHLNINDIIVCNYTYDIMNNLIIQEWSNTKSKEKEFEIFIYLNSSKIKELFISQEGISERLNTYYENGLEKTSKLIHPENGNIIYYNYYEYEYN